MAKEPLEIPAATIPLPDSVSEDTVKQSDLPMGEKVAEFVEEKPATEPEDLEAYVKEVLNLPDPDAPLPKEPELIYQFSMDGDLVKQASYSNLLMDGHIQVSREIYDEFNNNPLLNKYLVDEKRLIEHEIIIKNVAYIVKDHQFFIQLFYDKAITEQEAYLTAEGVMPKIMTDAIKAIPSPQERVKQTLYSKSTTEFKRDDTVVDLVFKSLKWNDQKCNNFWEAAAQR